MKVYFSPCLDNELVMTEVLRLATEKHEKEQQEQQALEPSAQLETEQVLVRIESGCVYSYWV